MHLRRPDFMSIIRPSVDAVNLLSAKTYFPCLSSLSLANIPVPIGPGESATLPLFIALSKLITSLPSLRSVLFQNLAISTAHILAILPVRIERLELLDYHRTASLHALFDALAGLQKLQHLRILFSERNLWYDELSGARACPGTRSRLPALQSLVIEQPRLLEGWLLGIFDELEHHFTLPKLHMLGISLDIRTIPDDFPSRRLAQSLACKETFPLLQIVQLPTATSWHEPSQFCWTHNLQKWLSKENITLRIDENHNNEFKSFSNALEKLN